MKKKTNTIGATKKILGLFLMGLVIASCHKDKQDIVTETSFNKVDLVANNSQVVGARVDPGFVNGWGIAFSPTGTLWISAQATGLSAVYDKDGNQVLASVTIPSSAAASGGHPTGQVFNSTTDFAISGGNPAKFIFAGTDGIISAWNSGVAAVKVIDRSGAAAYTGITIASDGSANFIYAANFRTAVIDVFDKNYSPVTKPFTDPAMPSGYAPFNIQNVNGLLYVTYAQKGPDGLEAKGAGLGYVDIYNPDGSFAKRFASQGELNAPWGIAVAPSSFFSNGSGSVVLIGNFGDGNINAFGMDGSSLGKLKSGGTVIAIDGLWGISFAPSTATTVDPNRLYYAAGPNGEQNGVFGYITR